jgi:hypothetical protein
MPRRLFACLLVGLLATACGGKASESRQVADKFTDLYYTHAHLAEAAELTSGAARTRLQGELAAVKGVPADSAADKPRVTLKLVSENAPSPTSATYVYNVDPQTAGIGPLAATVGLANEGGTWRVVTLEEKERNP